MLYSQTCFKVDSLKGGDQNLLLLLNVKEKGDTEHFILLNISFPGKIIITWCVYHLLHLLPCSWKRIRAWKNRPFIKEHRKLPSTVYVWGVIKWKIATRAPGMWNLINFVMRKKLRSFTSLDVLLSVSRLINIIAGKAFHVKQICQRLTNCLP